LALFSLRKSEILDNPLVAISGKHFMKEEAHLFYDNKALEENIAAIVYNVNKDKSSEVLLKNNIEDIFLKGNLVALKEVKKHSDFKIYFNNTIQKSTFLSTTPENVSLIFEEIKDVVSANVLKGYWEKFANNLSSRSNEEYLNLYEWHKNIFLNTHKNTAKKIADQIVYVNKGEFEKSLESVKYYLIIYDLIKFINVNSLKFKASIFKVEFKPKDFVEYIDKMYLVFKEGECTFKDLQIYTDPKELNEYFIEHKDGFVEVLYKYLHVIEYLNSIDKSYKFDSIQPSIDSELESNDYSDSNEIMKLITINKVLNGKRKITLIDEAIGTFFLDHNGSKTEDPYFDIIANQIAHLMTIVPKSNIFVNELESIENATKIAEVIQYYISYGDLLKVVIEKDRPYPLVNEIIKILSVEYYGFSQSLLPKWVFRNLDKIKSELFNENFIKFLTQFDKWEDEFKIEEISPVLDLREAILEETFNKENLEYKSIKLLYNAILNAFTNTTKEIWIENFNTDSNFYFALKGLIEYELFDNKITKNPVFMEAYDDYLMTIAKNEKPIPDDEEFWNDLLDNNYLDKRKLKRIFDNILDVLINHPELNANQIKFFSKGLFEYSSNIISKADEVCRKIILNLKDDINIYNYVIENYQNKIIEIINASTGKYNQDLSEMFYSYTDGGGADTGILNNVFEKTNLKIPENKTEGESTESE
jgi:hypothetical protein